MSVTYTCDICRMPKKSSELIVHRGTRITVCLAASGLPGAHEEWVLPPNESRIEICKGCWDCLLKRLKVESEYLIKQVQEERKVLV